MKVRQTDVAGNTSSVGTPDVHAGYDGGDAWGVALGDTGTSGSDRITSSGVLSLSGNRKSGATVQYSTDGGTTWTSSFSAAEGRTR